MVLLLWRLVCGSGVVRLPVGLSWIVWPWGEVFYIWTFLGEIGVISPSRVVSVGVGIITWSGESCIDLLIRNISIISNSRTVIYIDRKSVV